jgi:hypothetical protein
VLKPLAESALSGLVDKSNWVTAYEYTDATYLKTWISVAEHILHFVVTQEDCTEELYKLGMEVDRDKTKNKPWLFSNNSWSIFEAARTKKSAQWEKERDVLLSLRIYIVLFFLKPYEKIIQTIEQSSSTLSPSLLLDVPLSILKLVHDAKDVPLDLSSLPWGWFITPGEQKTLVSTLSQLKSYEKSWPDDMTVEEKNKQIAQYLSDASQTLEGIKQSAQLRQKQYVVTVYYLYRRHQETLPLCKATCQLLMYYMACKDAFDISMQLYDKNQTLTFPNDYFQNSHQFLHMSSLFGAVYCFTKRNNANLSQCGYVSRGSATSIRSH